MIYPGHLSLVELAIQYAMYHDESCLVELKRRDKLNKMTYDELIGLSFKEPDNQLDFDYHNVGDVEDIQWKEAYEAGFRAGGKHGLKFAETITKHKEVSREAVS